MKIFVALVVLLAALSVAVAIPQKRQARPPNAFQIALMALLEGEVPNVQALHREQVLEDISMAFRNGQVNERFGRLIEERINSHPRGKYLLTYISYDARSPDSLVWEVRDPNNNYLVRTIAFTNEGDFKEL